MDYIPLTHYTRVAKKKNPKRTLNTQVENELTAEQSFMFEGCKIRGF